MTTPHPPSRQPIPACARGNRPDAVGAAVRAGSIPACAGEPEVSRRIRCQRRVYPRVCGGTAPWKMARPTRWGLSPRVRGNQRLGAEAGRLRRSIPACAGEPGQAAPDGRCNRVYPRVCGGTAGGLPKTERGPGLSPRVRGNPKYSGTEATDARSIPACAGEPRKYFRMVSASTVYPRVCGGTPTPLPEGGNDWGLSPRVRGNRHAAPCPVAAVRSIPACAGEPGD